MKKVWIFLSTYNGEKYIEAQLESLFAQKDVDISILVRDDGSTDNTINILKRYEDSGKIKLIKGLNQGYKKSFISLVKENVYSDYYAFCDQDDVWLPEKLSRAISMIEKSEVDNRPILYASSLQRVDKNLNFLSMQNFKNLKLTLEAEFTRHRLAGCSFVFNNKLRNLLKESQNIDCSHDKLASILCIACGGEIIFDKSSYILFRRHGKNTSVDSLNFLNKAKKELRHYLLRQNNASILAKDILAQYYNQITSQNRTFLNLLAGYKKSYLKTFNLALNQKINCGFWYFNLFIRFMILLRLF